jgi:hypothetical protein
MISAGMGSLWPQCQFRLGGIKCLSSLRPRKRISRSKVSPGIPKGERKECFGRTAPLRPQGAPCYGATNDWHAPDPSFAMTSFDRAKRLRALRRFRFCFMETVFTAGFLLLGARIVALHLNTPEFRFPGAETKDAVTADGFEQPFFPPWLSSEEPPWELRRVGLMHPPFVGNHVHP